MMCIAVVFSAAPAGSFREMVDRRRGIFRLGTKRSKTKQKKKATCNGVCYIFNIVDMNNNY